METDNGIVLHFVYKFVSVWEVVAQQVGLWTDQRIMNLNSGTVKLPLLGP